jgi:hypothetical protein
MLRGTTVEVCCRPNPEEVRLDIGPSVHTKAMYPHIDKFDSDLIRARVEIWKSRACGDGYHIPAKVFRIRRQLHGTRLRPRKYCHPGGTLVHRHDHRPIRASHREQPSVGALPKHSHRAASQLGHGHAIALKSLLGTGATEGLLVLIFMAITSTVWSSMIAVSSVISLDFYRTYINPKASDKKTLQVSHIGLVFHGAFMAGFALMSNYAGATNDWSTYFRPIIACPGIILTMLAL